MKVPETVHWPVIYLEFSRQEIKIAKNVKLLDKLNFKKGETKILSYSSFNLFCIQKRINAELFFLYDFILTS